MHSLYLSPEVDAWNVDDNISGQCSSSNSSLPDFEFSPNDFGPPLASNDHESDFYQSSSFLNDTKLTNWDSRGSFMPETATSRAIDPNCQLFGDGLLASLPVLKLADTHDMSDARPIPKPQYTRRAKHISQSPSSICVDNRDPKLSTRLVQPIAIINSAKVKPKIRPTSKRKMTSMPISAVSLAEEAEESHHARANSSHNQIEKNYRTRLNFSFDKLLRAVEVANSKSGKREHEEATTANLSKGEVLNVARRKLQDLGMENQQLMNELQQLRANRRLACQCGAFEWQPKFDIHETAEAYELHGELPGLKKENVAIEFNEPQTIHIHGKIRQKHTSGTHTKKNQSKTFYFPALTTVMEATTHIEDKRHPEPKYWLTERSIGGFSWAFTFPACIQNDKVTAKMEDGMINIVVPKTETHISHHIDIQ